MKRVLKKNVIISISGIFLSMTLCQRDNALLHSDNNACIQIGTQKDSITITWENDTINNTIESEGVKGFNVYYRQHGTNEWMFYNKVDENTCVIKKDLTGEGCLNFAVCSKSEKGTVSDLHSSLDSTAEPSCGWFLSWE